MTRGSGKHVGGEGLDDVDDAKQKLIIISRSEDMIENPLQRIEALATVVDGHHHPHLLLLLRSYRRRASALGY